MSYKLQIHPANIPLLEAALLEKGYVRQTAGVNSKAVTTAPYLFVDTDILRYQFAYSERQFSLCKFPERQYEVRAVLETSVKPRETVIIDGKRYFKDIAMTALDGLEQVEGEDY